MKLLVATGNMKKKRELEELLSGTPVELITLRDISPCTEVEETGTTFRDNAVLKALGYAEQSGLLTLGEDSGLCCDALDGAPGVYSARFASDAKSDEANNQKLLEMMKTLPDNCRGAHYACAIAVARPGELLAVFEGDVHGFITREPKGTNGFGYDPLFYYLPFKMTFGEAPCAMKHQVSHRAKAFKKLCGWLSGFLETTRPATGN